MIPTNVGSNYWKSFAPTDKYSLSEGMADESVGSSVALNTAPVEVRPTQQQRQAHRQKNHKERPKAVPRTPEKTLCAWYIIVQSQQKS